jgi:hypothetical protein
MRSFGGLFFSSLHSHLNEFFETIFFSSLHSHLNEFFETMSLAVAEKREGKMLMKMASMLKKVVMKK